MQTGKFAREIQSNPVSAANAIRTGPIEPLEHMTLSFRGNCPAGIPDSKENNPIAGAGRNLDATAGSIVLSRILEKVLYNQGYVLFLAGDDELGRDVPFDRYIG